jgi:hypothetical protein
MKIDLSHLKINIPRSIRNNLRKNIGKLDDIGDAFLHACRELFHEPSNYRTFVPGQTLFQTNRCIVVRFTVRWFLFQIIHIENQSVTLNHIESHRTNINQKTNLKAININDEIFQNAIPVTFANALQFEHSTTEIPEADTIQIILRHTHGAVPHVMLQHLKKYITKKFENRHDYSSTSTCTFFKQNKQTYHFENKKLAIIQETSGKHIDAVQILPKFVNFNTFIKTNTKTTNKLDETELIKLYNSITTHITNTQQDTTNLLIDRLTIPRHIFQPFINQQHIQTNNSHNNYRAPTWHIDLLLCAINNSVIRPHFKGNANTT